LRFDLEAARSTWLHSIQDAQKRERMAECDFLAYRDSGGRYLDFHALRHSYISHLVQSGASAKTCQTLARHSTVTLTLDRYAHAGIYDLAAALEALPPLLPDRSSVRAQAATGTGGARDFSGDEAEISLGPNLGPYSAVSGDFLRQTETEVASAAGRE